MNQNLFYKIWGLFCMLMLGGFQSVDRSLTPKATKPNIVLVLIDDMAWADVGYNGGGNGFYETPNLDALARDGIVFNRFYPGGPNCAPTRACIVSGMYTPRTKIYQPNGESKGKVSNMRWHVPAKERAGDEHLLDSRTDMDSSITSIAEVMNSAGYITSRIGKWHLGPDNQGFVESTQDGTDTSRKKYYNDKFATDRMTQSATEFFERNTDKPFFLYFSLWDVHTPLVAKEKVVEKYETKWSSWTDKSLKWDPTYAAMIEVTDSSVGILRGKLKELGLDENTLFMVASDNGGPAGHTNNLPLRGAKGSMYEGGIRTFASAVWPGKITAGTSSDYPINGVDLLPTFAEIGDAYLPERQPVDGKSLLSLLNSEENLKERDIFWYYPLYLAGRDAKSIDRGWEGDNIFPKYGTNKRTWRAVPSSTIMRGDWKLIYFYEYDKYELYNLAKDVGETKDLSESNPEIARKLYERLMKWVKDTDADVPTELNPDFVAE